MHHINRQRWKMMIDFKMERYQTMRECIHNPIKLYSINLCTASPSTACKPLPTTGTLQFNTAKLSTSLVLPTHSTTQYRGTNSGISNHYYKNRPAPQAFILRTASVEVQMSCFNPIHRKCAFPSSYNWASPWYILRGYDLS